jgi:hypothetical protein
VGDLADLTDIQSFFRSLGELVDLQGEVKQVTADALENQAPAAPAESADAPLDLDEPFTDPVSDAISEGAPVPVEDNSAPDSTPPV